MIREFNNEPQAKAIAESLGLLITKHRGVYLVSNSKEELLTRYNLEYYSRENIFYDRDVFATSCGGYLVISDKNIVDASSIKLPYNMKDCSYMFYKCLLLEIPPKIPEGVMGCRSMFEGCTSLKEAPIIPKGVLYCSYMFRGCTSLETPPKIPESVEYCNHMFHDCISLKTSPHFPENCDTYEALFNTPFNRKQV